MGNVKLICRYLKINHLRCNKSVVVNPGTDVQTREEDLIMLHSCCQSCYTRIDRKNNISKISLKNVV